MKLRSMRVERDGPPVVNRRDREIALSGVDVSEAVMSAGEIGLERERVFTAAPGGVVGFNFEQYLGQPAMRRSIFRAERQRLAAGFFGFCWISRAAICVGEVNEIMRRRSLFNRSLGQSDGLLVLLRLPRDNSEQQQRIWIARTLLEDLLIAPRSSAEVACSVALQSFGEQGRGGADLNDGRSLRRHNLGLCSKAIV